MVYIPNGLAHGFYCLSKEAIVVYNATNIYSTNHDSGIHWDSLDTILAYRLSYAF
ncbi:dTDP-4-dehydrorhamnose 3,5-epimerase family protein [Anaerobacillus sp. HL2]|nr:dTDP-4-dehydrorhamnose 3,5-epimerase family protein [Anaerobacillus sp. HL2]